MNLIKINPFKLKLKVSLFDFILTINLVITEINYYCSWKPIDSVNQNFNFEQNHSNSTIAIN